MQILDTENNKRSIHTQHGRTSGQVTEFGGLCFKCCWWLCLYINSAPVDGNKKVGVQKQTSGNFNLYSGCGGRLVHEHVEADELVKVAVMIIPLRYGDHLFGKGHTKPMYYG